MKRARGRPRGSTDGAGKKGSKLFAVRFDGWTWFVKQGTAWRRAREIALLAHVITTSSGNLVGTGVVTRTGPQTFAVTP